MCNICTNWLFSTRTFNNLFASRPPPRLRWHFPPMTTRARVFAFVVFFRILVFLLLLLLLFLWLLRCLFVISSIFCFFFCKLFIFISICFDFYSLHIKFSQAARVCVCVYGMHVAFHFLFFFSCALPPSLMTFRLLFTFATLSFDSS